VPVDFDGERQKVLRLATLAAHQLRSPLGTIQTALSTLAGGFLGPLEPRQRDLIQQASKSAVQSLTLISDLLRMRRLDEIRPEDLTPLDPVPIFESALERVRDGANAKGVELIHRVEIRDRWAGRVHGDPALLQEAMYVLLDNAVKYTPSAGSVTAHLALRDDPASDDGVGRILLEVVDTGIGIPPEAAEHLFDEFYRAPNAKAADRSGSGLGLPFAVRAAQLMGGRVFLESADGGGARGVIDLPSVTAAEAAALQAAAGEDLQAEVEPSRRVVIVGGVTAGSKVAAKLMRLDPRAQITMVERGRAAAYAGCGLPYYVSGVVRDQRDVISTALGEERDSSLFHDIRNLHTLDFTEARSIDRERRTVRVRRLSDGEESVLPYDTLVLATGASPAVPDLPGVDLGRIYTLQGAEAAEAIRRELSVTAAKDVVIVGGGLLGCEITEAVAASGARISLVEQCPHLLGIVDAELALLVQRYLEANGVKVVAGARVAAFEGGADVGTVVLDDGRRLGCDFAILATGFRPEVGLARRAGLAIGDTGAIRTDDRLRTSDPRILAVGDCIETRHLVTGEPTWVPMGSTAVKQGRIAAINACGGEETFPGVVGSTVLKIFGMTVARTGLGEDAARQAGFDPVIGLSPSLDCAHYLPTARPITLKMIADRTTGRILGMQGIGEGRLDKRVDIVATAITAGLDVDRFATLDMCFAPPYGLAMDSLLAVANIIRNKRAGIVTGIAALELRRRLGEPEPPFVLDVRLPGGHAEARLPGSVNVPLGSLRGRLHQVPKDREVVVVSRTGTKSYEATLILRDHGFERVAMLDGGLEAWPYDLERR
jgi:NADPH-dependent 2,4-dienoyl-CoA reductase/sulfur reductase-like enzyme/rhodanese-related sulfurtransferase